MGAFAAACNSVSTCSSVICTPSRSADHIIGKIAEFGGSVAAHLNMSGNDRSSAHTSVRRPANRWSSRPSSERQNRSNGAAEHDEDVRGLRTQQQNVLDGLGRVKGDRDRVSFAVRVAFWTNRRSIPASSIGVVGKSCSGISARTRPPVRSWARSNRAGGLQISTAGHLQSIV
jgi:hypothetical protein